jgi:hypothetical protein
MRSTTHIAGPAITVGGRTVRRCSLCGEKLCDGKGAMAPLRPDGTPPGFPTWEPGRLVRVSHGNPARRLLLPDADGLPADSCLDLVE